MSSNRLIQPVFFPLFFSSPLPPPFPLPPNPKTQPIGSRFSSLVFSKICGRQVSSALKENVLKEETSLIKGNTNLECPKRRQKIQFVQHTRFNCSWPQITSTRVGHSSKEVLVILRNKLPDAQGRLATNKCMCAGFYNKSAMIMDPPKIRRASLQASLSEPYPRNIGLTEPALTVRHPSLDVLLELGKIVYFLINIWEHSFLYNRTKISQ